jgi:hypothetical protein
MLDFGECVVTVVHHGAGREREQIVPSRIVG